jgi:hypothetical protein
MQLGGVPLSTGHLTGGLFCTLQVSNRLLGTLQLENVLKPVTAPYSKSFGTPNHTMASLQPPQHCLPGVLSRSDMPPRAVLQRGSKPHSKLTLLHTTMELVATAAVSVRP